MAARSTWKGSLKLSLISIPIRVFPATNPSSDVKFRQFHRKCHTPIQMKRWCPHCEEEVALDDVVKGYESAKGHFVMVEKEDIEKIRPESTRTVDLSHILDESAIDPIYIERAYFIAPDNKAAGASFAVMREALEEVGRQIADGKNVTAAFQSVGLFPPLVLRMLRVGEATGALDRALQNVSYFYNRDVKESIARVQTMIEPVMTMIVGLLLGWVMLSVVGPIYDTISKIKI